MKVLWVYLGHVLCFTGFFQMFQLFWTGFYMFWMGFNGFHCFFSCLFISFTRLKWVLQALNGFYRVLSRFCGFYWVSHVFHGCSWVSLVFECLFISFVLFFFFGGIAQVLLNGFFVGFFYRVFVVTRWLMDGPVDTFHNVVDALPPGRPFT